MAIQLLFWVSWVTGVLGAFLAFQIQHSKLTVYCSPCYQLVLLCQLDTFPSECSAADVRPAAPLPSLQANRVKFVFDNDSLEVSACCATVANFAAVLKGWNRGRMHDDISCCFGAAIPANTPVRSCLAPPQLFLSSQVLVGPGSGKESENAFVGGQNRWRYDTFVYWEYWWPAFPVLVYFKVRKRISYGTA